ncbi:hypothetical protein PpBr36_00814 [Pyricularia pennisetigena]|uniref:hypothetical protein n=1 Tax=Pyricularia pennisetigena TaxID=1578925 RepID=UPI001150D212|nr:hypothetical protein PpBr36_00814 [Pyricularia pennisetigena]TLS29846.1 hypothetical protein PpBr36_00814 [Pyricularia pennisetigena]
MTAPVSASWGDVPSRDQLFVLVTGTNSGVGTGIAQRLIDEFLAKRSLTSHLILIVTTRSRSKSQQTIDIIQKHVRKAAEAKKLRARAGPSYDPESTVSRIHLVGILVDLCNLRSVYAAANLLKEGGAPAVGSNCPSSVRVPRLDSIILNAGYGNWTSLNWWKLFVQSVTKGFPVAFTWPKFKNAAKGTLVDPLTGRILTKEQAIAEGRTTRELLGETFTANLFGHYMLAHALLPLLRRTPEQLREEALSPARIIWQGSVTPGPDDFSMSDPQGLRHHDAYNCVKRLNDILVFSSTLPKPEPIATAYLLGDDNKDGSSNDKLVAPRMYLTHPGITNTSIFALPWLLSMAWGLVMYLTRWVGSVWHVGSPYNAAVTPVWIALEEQARLDEIEAHRCKWGSACSRWRGTLGAKKTEVQGWGWDGRLASDPNGRPAESEKGFLSRELGRHWQSVELTQDALNEFEELGAECWREMERLRIEWEERLGVRPAANGDKVAMAA